MTSAGSRGEWQCTWEGKDSVGTTTPNILVIIIIGSAFSALIMDYLISQIKIIMLTVTTSPVLIPSCNLYPTQSVDEVG